MPKTLTSQLFDLIKAMSKAEKRHFKLFAARNTSGRELKFVRVFEVLEKQKIYDEKVLLDRLPMISKNQLSNIKAHLYRQLLTSLRLLQDQEPDIQIRESLDFAQLLYSKGLYRNSLKMLEKAKSLAELHHQDLLLLEIVEFEKRIESRHITRSIETRVEDLTQAGSALRKRISNAGDLSDLALQLYGLYLKIGHVKSQADYERVKAQFGSSFPAYDWESLSFNEQIYLCQSRVWYHFIIQNFPYCFRWAQLWVSVFDRFPQHRITEPDLYMKGLHNLMAALLNCGRYEAFCVAFDQLDRFVSERGTAFNENSSLLAFLYLETNRINRYFMEGQFSLGTTMIPRLEQLLELHANQLDHHRILIFYYKIACLYFGSGDNKRAIQYLNRIINFKAAALREDIQCFARILNLIAHYELGNDDLIDYQIRSTYRFLLKMKEMQQTQQAIFQFLRASNYMDRNNMKADFVRLRNQLKKVADIPYERRPFLYLDVISWLTSKIEGRTVESVIRDNFVNPKA